MQAGLAQTTVAAEVPVGTVDQEAGMTSSMCLPGAALNRVPHWRGNGVQRGSTKAQPRVDVTPRRHQGLICRLFLFISIAVREEEPGLNSTLRFIPLHVTTATTGEPRLNHTISPFKSSVITTVIQR